LVLSFAIGDLAGAIRGKKASLSFAKGGRYEK